jgi:hypothetical protein
MRIPLALGEKNVNVDGFAMFIILLLFRIKIFLSSGCRNFHAVFQGIAYLPMGLYDKINNSGAGRTRKLMDYFIFTKGRRVEMARIGYDTDFWGNEAPTALSQDPITAIILFPPGELPLIRIREGQGMSERAGESAVFFYDILPVEAYFQFKDRIEKGDVFFFTVEDEARNKMPIVLKVVDSAGAVTTQLVWRKFLCSPVTGLQELPEDVQAKVLEKVGVAGQA